MIPKAPTLSPAMREQLARDEERVLSREEFNARAAAPMSEHEREDFEGLVDWFTRRYPTAGERMRAMRLRLHQHRRRHGVTRIPES